MQEHRILEQKCPPPKLKLISYNAIANGSRRHTKNASAPSVRAEFCSKTHLAVKKPCCGFRISVYMNISLKSSLCTYVDVYILWIPPCVDVYMCIYMVYSICHMYIAVCMYVMSCHVMLCYVMLCMYIYICMYVYKYIGIQIQLQKILRPGFRWKRRLLQCLQGQG